MLDEKGRLEIDMLAGGEAMLFTGGMAVEGTWSRDSYESPTIFKNRQGEEFKLNVGNSWIQVVDDTVTVTYE